MDLTVNTKLLRDVADKILATPQNFDMDTWIGDNDCGTSYCIGGWAMALSGYTTYKEQHFNRPDGTLVTHPAEEANRLFGFVRSPKVLDVDEGNSYRGWVEIYMMSLTAEQAAKKLYELANEAEQPEEEA